MRIQIAIAALSVNVTNTNNETVLDYSLENYKLDGDIEGCAAALLDVVTNVKKLVEDTERKARDIERAAHDERLREDEPVHAEA